jgi:hypothetical protein
MSLVSFCDLAHNGFAWNLDASNRVRFSKRALVVSAARAFAFQHSEYMLERSRMSTTKIGHLLDVLRLEPRSLLTLGSGF